MPMRTVRYSGLALSPLLERVHRVVPGVSFEEMIGIDAHGGVAAVQATWLRPSAMSQKKRCAMRPFPLPVVPQDPPVAIAKRARDPKPATRVRLRNPLGTEPLPQLGRCPRHVS